MKVAMAYYKNYIESVVQLFPELCFDESKFTRVPGILI